MPTTAPFNGREQVRVAVVQRSPAFLDPDRCVERAGTHIAEAAAQGADLVVFPEVWLSGYPYWTEGWDSDLRAWVGGRVAFRAGAVTVPGEHVAAIGEQAARAGVHVVMGADELDARPAVNTIYNSLLFFGPDGALLARHRKLMPTFGERQFWGMGDGGDLVVVQTEIGRIGGLICGEHLMTLARAALIAQGEEIHVAAFPGSFALHTGPRLEEPDTSGAAFWGHSSVRAHALEAGAFVASACGVLDPADVPADFPHAGTMNVDYAHGGSEVIAPLGIPLSGPEYGETIVYADCPAWMKQAWNAIVDTMGHYARPDVLRLSVRDEHGWREAIERAVGGAPEPLLRAADRHAVDPELVVREAERLTSS